MKKFTIKVLVTLSKLNNAAKILLILATVCLIQTICVMLFNLEGSSPSEVTIRSTMSSIFGYFFGQQCKNHFNIVNYNSQIYFAGFISFITLGAAILMTWLPINQNTPATADIRNLLLTTVGFIICMVKQVDE